LARRAVLVTALLLLCLPATATANGDPASDYLLAQSTFLPFGAKIDSGAVKRLQDVIRGSDESGFKIKAALILTPQDLGTAFSLFNKPQRYAEFLGLELSFVYRDRLVVVMPKGFGYTIGGDPDPKAARVLARLTPPGADATKEAQAATIAIQRLAAAAGHRVAAPKTSDSASRDRITIAAAVTAAVALIAGITLYRRQRTPRA
jgi:hypothetical protein